MPTLYNFLLNKSAELGAEKCSNCGEQDASFGLGTKDRTSKGGFCIFCSSSTKTYSKIKTLQYCLEVYKEVFINYNDKASPEDKKMARWVIDDMLTESKNNNKLPSNEKIIKFQTLNIGLGKNLGGYYPIGSAEKMAGYVIIHGKEVGPKLEESFLKAKGDAYAIGIVCFCISYILNFETENEFVLPTAKKGTASTPPLQTPQPKPPGNKNSGCMSVFLLATIVTLIIIAIL